MNLYFSEVKIKGTQLYSSPKKKEILQRIRQFHAFCINFSLLKAPTAWNELVDFG